MSASGSVPTSRGRAPLTLRVVATLLAVVLAFGAVGPSLAWAAETETEGEGSAPPGVGLPGLEEGPGFEPGGAETGLEEVPEESGEEEGG